MKILLFIYFIIPSLAIADNFVLKPGEIEINVPWGWETAKNLFGVQLMIAGPMENERRPVVTIDSTHFSYEFNSKDLMNDQGSYRMGRLNWIMKNSGKVIDFLPYKIETLEDGIKDHVIGYKYEMDGVQFVERSHYIPCKKVLFNIKVLLPLAQEEEYSSKINKMIKSFECVRGQF